MANDTKSRYSIINELSDTRIKIRKHIADLKGELDTREYETSKTVKNLEKSIKNQEDNYEQEYLDESRNLKVALNLYKGRVEREIARLEKEIETLKDTYKPNFLAWKKRQEEEIRNINAGLLRFQDTHNAKIKNAEIEFAENEKGITDLKDMSKENN